MSIQNSDVRLGTAPTKWHSFSFHDPFKATYVFAPVQSLVNYMWLEWTYWMSLVYEVWAKWFRKISTEGRFLTRYILWQHTYGLRCHRNRCHRMGGEKSIARLGHQRKEDLFRSCLVILSHKPPEIGHLGLMRRIPLHQFKSSLNTNIFQLFT